MTTHEKWDVLLRVAFGVIAALFTLFVFLIGESQKTANEASTARANAQADLAKAQASELDARRTNAIERTSILGAEALVRAYVDSDQELACNAFLALSAVAALAHEDGLEELPKQVNAILSAKPTFAVECKVANSTTSGATSESFDIAEFRIKSAVQSSVAENVKDTEWYAVVLSLRASTSNAMTRSFVFADQLQSRLADRGEDMAVRVWRTSISDHYAVTVGGPSDKSDAERIAEMLRSSGLVSDAFAQDERNWIQQERNGAEPIVTLSQKLVGFRLFFHIPAAIDSRALRTQLVNEFEGLGASIGGFDNQEDRFGAGVDFARSSSDSRSAAEEVADLLNSVIAPRFDFEKLAIRPQTAITNEQIIGVWIDAVSLPNTQE